jgi:hypothetical protein
VRCSVLCWNFSTSWMDLKLRIRSRSVLCNDSMSESFEI